MDLFDIKINTMDNINWDLIKNIEYKCQHKIPLSPNEVQYYLSYVCYQVRKKLADKKNQSIDNYAFLNQCDTAQAMIANYFNSLNIENMPVDTQKAITDEIIGHSFTIASFLVNDKNMFFIIDPTYTQFFDKNHCSFENYKIIAGKIVSTPDPGYFINKLPDEKKALIKEFLYKGFMELNEENSKIYGDSFYKTKVGITPDVSKYLNMNGNVYIKGFLKGQVPLSYDENGLKQNNLWIEPVYQENMLTKRKAS